MKKLRVRNDMVSEVLELALDCLLAGGFNFSVLCFPSLPHRVVVRVK